MVSLVTLMTSYAQKATFLKVTHQSSSLDPPLIPQTFRF